MSCPGRAFVPFHPYPLHRSTRRACYSLSHELMQTCRCLAWLLWLPASVVCIDCSSRHARALLFTLRERTYRSYLCHASPCSQSVAWHGIQFPSSSGCLGMVVGLSTGLQMELQLMPYIPLFGKGEDRPRVQKSNHRCGRLSSRDNPSTTTIANKRCSLYGSSLKGHESFSGRIIVGCDTCKGETVRRPANPIQPGDRRHDDFEMASSWPRDRKEKGKKTGVSASQTSGEGRQNERIGGWMRSRGSPPYSSMLTAEPVAVISSRKFRLEVLLVATFFLVEGQGYGALKARGMATSDKRLKRSLLFSTFGKKVMRFP